MSTATVHDAATSLPAAPGLRSTSAPSSGRAILYVATAILCVLTVACVFRLHARDLRDPFVYEGDALVVLTWTKAVMENPWFLHNPSLGMPTGSDLHDFPTSDSLQFLMLKAIGLVAPNPFLVVNLYYLVTFLLASLFAVHAFRETGIAPVVSVVLAMLYALLPFHFFRGTPHLFLSGYYLLPLMCLVLLRLQRGENTLWEHDRQQEKTVLRLWGWRTVRLAVFCLLFASTGIYWTAFAVLFLGVAGAGASVARRSAVPFVSAMLLGAFLVAGFLANMAPSIAYRLQHGANHQAVVRHAAETEHYGLKIVQMLLPTSAHNSLRVARFRNKYDASAPLVNENGTAALGLVGSAGFLILVGHALFGRRRLAATWLDGAAVLSLAGVLFATVGGFSSVVSYLASPLIRAPNRISTYLAFFSLLAVGLMLQRVASRIRSGPVAVAWYAALALLLAVGVYDQTPSAFRTLQTPVYVPLPAFLSDRAFVRRIEATVPAGAMVFQLPYVSYVGHEPPHTMGPYQHLTAYLHSSQVRWSYGAMVGRATDGWQKATANLPTADMVEEMKFKGFAGVWIDRRGYADRAEALEADLFALLGVGPLTSDDGHLAYYPFGA